MWTSSHGLFKRRTFANGVVHSSVVDRMLHRDTKSFPANWKAGSCSFHIRTMSVFVWLASFYAIFTIVSHNSFIMQWEWTHLSSVLNLECHLWRCLILQKKLNSVQNMALFLWHYDWRTLTMKNDMKRHEMSSEIWFFTWLSVFIFTFVL